MSDYANIITQAARQATVPGGIYGGIDYHGSPPWELGMAAGWRKLDERVDVTPPEGYRVAGWEYAQDTERADYAIETAIIEAIPVPVPERFAAGIDTPLLVLDAPDGIKGFGYTPAEDGTLLPIQYAHESPYDMEGLRIKIEIARADHQADKATKAATAANIAGKAAGAGNSLPAVRTELERLARLVAQMIGVLVLMFAATVAVAADVTLTWDAPVANEDGTPLVDLGGYEIMRGTTSQVYTWTSNVGKVTSKWFTGLTEGTTYYWSGRSYNTGGLYSDLATEFVWLCPDKTAPVIAPLGNRLLWVSLATEKAACPNMLLGIEVSDNITPSPDIVLGQSPAAGTLLAIGNHTVTVTAADAAGNVATATAIVKVQRRRPMPPTNLRVAP
jgi:hypothetical protein